MVKRILLAVAVVMGVTFTLSRTAWAQDPIHKMGRGIVNVLTGWIELPKQIHLGKQEENPVAGISRGLVKGVGLTVLRGGFGLYEACTFVFPYPKGFTSPYEQMGLNDYAWE